MELFDERVVLFQSDEGGEHLLVTCEPSGMGGLVVRQTSEGPLTQWCYEESPHVVETFVAHEALVVLEHFYGVGTSNQVARMLSISFADYDCAQRGAVASGGAWRRVRCDRKANRSHEKR